MFALTFFMYTIAYIILIERQKRLNEHKKVLQTSARFIYKLI